MRRGNEKRWTRDFINEYSRNLHKYQADMDFIQIKLRELKSILIDKTTPLLHKAALSFHVALDYEELRILELKIQDQLIKELPMFRNIPLFEEKLKNLRKLASLEEKKLSVAQTLLENEKKCGLYKLDDLCQEYQTYLLKKMGAKPETPVEKALAQALQNPALKNKAHNYYEKFIELDTLRTLLSVDPEHQFNNKASPEIRKADFVTHLNDKLEFFSTRSNEPLLFKDSEAGMIFLNNVREIVSPGPVEKNTIRKKL